MKIGDKIKFMRNTQNSIGVTIGNVYEVTGIADGDPYIINDNGDNWWYTGSQFDIVVDNSLEARIKKAMSLVGKRIKKADGFSFVPDTWGVGNIYGQHFTSQLDDNGLVVYVENADSICKVEEAEITTNTIKLTDDYDATITSIDSGIDMLDATIAKLGLEAQ